MSTLSAVWQPGWTCSRDCNTAVPSSGGSSTIRTERARSVSQYVAQGLACVLVSDDSVTSPLLTMPGMDADRARIELAMRAAVVTSDPYLTEIASHLIVAGGKRLRPVLAVVAGQLDGGHAIFAVFGAKVHLWTGRIAFVVMALLSILGMYFYNSPSGFLFAVILAIMMRIRHPEPMDSSPLDKKRIAIAILTLVIFVLCFVPFPIKLG